MKDYTVQVVSSSCGIYKVSAETEDKAHEAAAQLFGAELRYGEWTGGDIESTTTIDDEGFCDRTYSAKEVIESPDYLVLYNEIILGEDK